MRILIPATQTPYFTGGVVWPINRRDSDGFFRFWRTVWAQRDSVIVVEEDIAPTEEALIDLLDCDRPWCAQPYLHQGQETYYGLGCVKFDAVVMERQPNLWKDVADFANTDHEPREWRRLDFWSAALLYERGYERHHHTITVGRAQPAMAGWSNDRAYSAR